jgi:hypothetical protein
VVICSHKARIGLKRDPECAVSIAGLADYGGIFRMSSSKLPETVMLEDVIY